MYQKSVSLYSPQQEYKVFCDDVKGFTTNFLLNWPGSLTLQGEDQGFVPREKTGLPATTAHELYESSSPGDTAMPTHRSA